MDHMATLEMLRSGRILKQVKDNLTSYWMGNEKKKGVNNDSKIFHLRNWMDEEDY